MAADANIKNDAAESETYRLGLDAALKEAIQSFIDVRFVEEGEAESAAVEDYAASEGYFGYVEPMFERRMLSAQPYDAVPPRDAAPSYGAPASKAAAPPAKRSARDGVLGSIGKAIGELAHRGKHAKVPSEERAVEPAEKRAEELPCFEEEIAFEESTAIEESCAYDAALPVQEAPACSQSYRSYAGPAYAGTSSRERFSGASNARTVGLKQWLDEVDAPFSTTLLRLIDERGYDDVDVYKRAGMSRQLFSRIRSDAEYRPAKKTVLALAVALRLNADEARDLLERAGFALSHSDKRDLVVEYFLENGKHDLMAVNQALYEFDQPLL